MTEERVTVREVHKDGGNTFMAFVVGGLVVVAALAAAWFFMGQPGMETTELRVELPAVSAPAIDDGGSVAPAPPADPAP